MGATARHQTIAPFWTRLRQIVAYPFRGGALATLLVLTVAQVAAWLPLIGWLVGLLLLAVAYKYAFEALRVTAHGRLDPPETVLDLNDGVLLRFLAMQLLFIVGIVVAALLGGIALALLALAVIVLVQPGATMALAMDGSLRHAINPATWFALIARVGWPYLALVALLFVFQLSALNAAALFALALPRPLAELVAYALFLWGLFATFHLMGYLLYQYHETLGFEPEAAGLPDRPRDQDAELLEQAGDALREGRPDAALALLRDAVRVRAVSVEAHALYRRLLQQAGEAERDALLAHARRFIHLLVLERDERRALGIARESLDLDPDFTLLEGSETVDLARRALQLGQAGLALDLLQALRRAAPKDRAIPAAALLEAGLLVDRHARDQEAADVLAYARTRTDDPAVLAELDAALARLPSKSG
ncbi:hypothetical protein [Coralloluteibacterium thermophilus]